MQHTVKRLLAGCVVTGRLGLASAVAMAGDVGVAVNIAVPGVYGAVTIGGGGPAPDLIVARPVVAVPARVVVGVPPPEPLYLHVPPGHERHWTTHCHEYNACNRPVYFVSDHWYHDVYTPHHHEWERHEMERREIERHREEERRAMEERHAGERHLEHVEHVEHREHVERERAHYEHEQKHEHNHDHDHDDHDHGRH